MSSIQGVGMTSRRTRDRLVQRLRDEGITNHDVLNVIGQVPRHIFVDEALASRAYEDTALPIGAGQTISQPYIVARMTEALLADGPINKVLEIGSGSGYQTAILAALVEQVFSVERLAALQFQARERMHLPVYLQCTHETVRRERWLVGTRPLYGHCRYRGAAQRAARAPRAISSGWKDGDPGRGIRCTEVAVSHRDPGWVHREISGTSEFCADDFGNFGSTLARCLLALTVSSPRCLSILGTSQIPDDSGPPRRARLVCGLPRAVSSSASC